ncbi:MAG TPA: DUF5916 domain-containing protein, partial [Gammaproteobacteria bacterium]|nr:DUF5916 domain-containing protein [Gammaproteobacteria bacterium]
EPMNAIRVAACAAASLVCLNGALHAQPEVAAVADVSSNRVSSLAIPHSKEAIQIDGVLDDAIWRSALALPLTIETYPRENQTPVVETIAYLVENGDQLLIAFDARDPDPSSIRAYLRDRDSAFNDDFVGVVLDTFNDQRRAFEFFVNPFGVQMDLINDQVNGSESTSWEAIWDSAGQVNERGFTAELAIPFSQLRFPRTDGDQTWGIDVLRFWPRSQQVRISNNARDRNLSCYLCQLSKFTGFANAEPGKALEVVPTLTATRTDSAQPAPAPAGELEPGDFETEAGLGVRWGITPDLTLDVTFNPDFSQVEADVAQLEENTTFALSYPETRPFFIEGQDFFSSPLQAVYTRTVADPDAGAKFTGRTGKNTIGVFATNDAITNLLFPGPFGSQTTSLDQENDGFVGRYARGFGRTSQIGALVTSRQGDGYSNEVAGFDGRYFMNDNSTLRFQYLDSRTEYPASVATQFGQAEDLEGDAWRVEYRYGSRNWFAQVWHQDIDPTFRADSGFIGRVDLVQDRVQMNRNFYAAPSAWWTEWGVGFQSGRSETTDGQFINRNLQPYISFEGPMQSYAELGGGTREEYWNGVIYDLQGLFMYGQFRPRSGLNINMQLQDGEQIDFANSRLADARGYRPQIEWNATRHLLMRLRYSSDRLSTKEGAMIFDAKLTDLRLTWQFNVRSFVRLTLQDQDIERNVAAYLNPATDPRTESLATQLLYSYKLNPQTVLFAGYSDSAIDDALTGNVEMTGRTLFFKLSYAWTP